MTVAAPTGPGGKAKATEARPVAGSNDTLRWLGGMTDWEKPETMVAVTCVRVRKASPKLEREHANESPPEAYT